MASFNCLYEPWIPAKDKNGEISEYSILDILEKASELVEISDTSPLIEFGIHRLLITFLTDAFRYEDIEELSEDYLNDKFSMKKIKKYIKDCGDNSFDLFNEENPFLQTKYDETYDGKKEKTIALLVHQFPSGNNSIHFDHNFQNERELNFSECARVLSTFNLFCTAETQGSKNRRPSSINGTPPWYVLLKQENLFKTLILNIWIPNGLEIEIYEPGPVWRNKREIIPEKKVQDTSYLEGLTWMARRITLIPNDKNKVKEVYFQAGEDFIGYGTWIDPFLGYYYTEKNPLITSLKPKNYRSSWRDLNGLLLLKNKKQGNRIYIRPKIVDQFLEVNEFLSSEFDKNLLLKETTYGLVTNQAKYLNWMEEEFSIDKNDLEPRKAEFISQSIEMAEKEEFALKKSVEILLEDLSDSIQEGISKTYFENLKNDFFGSFLTSVSETPAEEPNWNEKPNEIWINSIIKALNNCFNEAEKLAGSRASSIKKIVKARNALSKEIGILLPKKEVKK